MEDERSSLIEDYAIIGDTETVAVVANDGSIDWFCAPRFDSGACFARLLGNNDNGFWKIAPVEGGRASRRSYREGTLVLETDFETPTGSVRITDCMPIRDHNINIVRRCTGLSGSVDMRMDLSIRFDYGSVVPWVRNIDNKIVAIAGPEALCLSTPVEIKGERFHNVAKFTVNEGDEVPFVLTWFQSHHAIPKTIDANKAIAETTVWWKKWSDKSTYSGKWADLVQRSAITLKALTYNPTGGIIAAGTTSLPEWIGSVRNWDYRYCWLRDATFSLYALMSLGYRDEAEKWRDWLLRSVAGAPDKIQIMYGAAGERRLEEYEVDWLSGYEGSAPVRVGNAAADQFQLDVYGEVFDALHQTQKIGIPPSPSLWPLALAILGFVEEAWRLPDDGIWEIRGERKHFTHSKVMAWVAFDRAIKSVKAREMPIDTTPWEAIRDEIHAQVCEKGFDVERNTFVQAYGSSELDASLLMLPLVGFLPATDPRIVGTADAIASELMVDGFVQRYKSASGVDGLPEGEGAFLPCSFWLADNYSLMGRTEEAHALFERLIALVNDVGLIAEEYDAKASRMLGNFPQAMTHVSLINTAYNLSGSTGPAHVRSGSAKSS
jgi:GH15 family glucan-1,4-alpha-glucosidase